MKYKMIKPFQIVWELIEFGIQALFVYVLAIILIVGILVFAINDGRKEWDREKARIEYVKVAFPKVEILKERECKRPAGCRILEDGTVEY